MDWETTAAVIAGLKYVGQPTIAGLKVVLGKMSGPSLDALGDGLAAPLRAWAHKRAERASGTVIDAAKLLHAAAIEAHEVPSSIFISILEKSSLQSEPEIRARWAALLANAATPSPSDMVLPGYIDVLAQLTPLHAQLLDVVYADWTMGRHDNHFFDSDDARVALATRVGGHISETTYELIVTDLERLLLIKPKMLDSINQLNSGVITYTKIRLTLFGSFFIRACSPPKPYNSYE